MRPQQNCSISFALDKSSSLPLFEQICRYVRQQVHGVNWERGQKLPATRTLAAELGVSRSTVVMAYEQLVAEGYIEGIKGSGYRVNYTEDAAAQPNGALRHITPGKKALPPTAGEQRQKLLQPGVADMRLFPYKLWAKTVAKVCRHHPEALLLCDDPNGNADLRWAICDHLHQWRGMNTEPEQVVVTSGSTDALERCINALTAKGDTIGLENPGYLPTRQFIQQQGYVIADLDIDDKGATLPNCNPQLILVTPSYQYPLGGAMAADRRQQLLQWASKNECWIVEDDYDSEFRYFGSPIPALASLDLQQRTLYVGSFSKLFSSQFRLGYVVIPKSLVPAFRSVNKPLFSRAPIMPQQPLADFMNNGDFYRYLRRARRIYAKRRRHLMNLLDEHLSWCGYIKDHQAGMQLTFHFSIDKSDKQIERHALQCGLGVSALSPFYADQRQSQQGLLLGFCGFTEDEITQGVKILAQLMAE
ncbi:PLP-dependent aminotransferase family protein [Photobacterium makurazakiensis]|uniref:MocR-like pyridoxine biosynthesis transcription factor PdxR n=1 Tax=Photobacterium makurazakiensis TaxID=2910234 RepID=UPI003D0C1E4C